MLITGQQRSLGTVLLLAFYVLLKRGVRLTSICMNNWIFFFFFWTRTFYSGNLSVSNENNIAEVGYEGGITGEPTHRWSKTLRIGSSVNLVRHFGAKLQFCKSDHSDKRSSNMHSKFHKLICRSAMAQYRINWTGLTSELHIVMTCYWWRVIRSG